MSRDLILYIEDSEAQRKSLKMAMEYRGYEMEVAGDVTSARKKFEELRGRLDVVILDMRLEDPEWPQLTGADVAIEYYNPQSPRPPEFLIHSAFSEVDYYKLALKLGVATFLEKSEYKQDDIIRRIRALAIRRTLSINNPDVTERIKQIVETSLSQSEALENFCREELEPKLFDRLGCPFVFLLSEGDRTRCCSREEGFPDQLPLYSVIQKMIYSDARAERLLRLDVGQFPSQPAPNERDVFQRLNGAAFVRLTNKGDLQLSIGLLPADPTRFPLPEPPVEMAMVLSEHLESAVIELFLTLLTKWTAFQTENETKRRELLRITAELCLYVGRYQGFSLDRLLQASPALSENRDFRHLKKMAEEMKSTGNLLESLAKTSAGAEGKRSKVLIDSLADFIKSLWDDMDGGANQKAIKVLGDCKVRTTPEDLSVIISSILQWFAQRFIETPSGTEPRISVHCRAGDRGIEATFEDRSERLTKPLRERLFYPFAEESIALNPSDDSNGTITSKLSLFIAKILIEVNHQGVLEDDSDAVSTGLDATGALLGHRFKLLFPNSISV